MLEFLSNPQWAGIAGIVAIIGLFLQYGRKKIRSSARENEKQFNYEVNDLAERFLLVYKAHDIEHAQIPQFVKKAGELSLADLSSNTALLKALDENLLSATCTHFGIQREWLDGGNVPIYDSPYFDKQLKEYIHFLVQLKKDHSSIEGFALKCPEDKLKHSEQNFDIALLFRGNIENMRNADEEPIWRYYPIADYNFWGYQRTRLQLKAMIHIANLFHIFISGCQMKKDEIKQIRKGTIFPGPLMEDRSQVAWHPDEYTFCEIDTFQPHDIEEAKQVREVIYKNFYQQLKKCDGIDLKRLQHSSQSHRKVLSC
jgi:hypothetical protein